MAAPPRPRQQCADRLRRRRLLRRRRPISASCAAIARCWSTAFPPARCARRCLPSAIRKWSVGSRSTPWCGPARARRRSPSARSGCPNSRPRTAGRSTALSCIRSSTATIPAPPRTEVVEAFADAILALDNSVPTGTYVDMCSQLPVVDPEKIKLADHHHARPIGRHRGLRRPDRSSSSGCRTRTSSSP